MKSSKILFGASMHAFVSVCVRVCVCLCMRQQTLNNTRGRRKEREIQKKREREHLLQLHNVNSHNPVHEQIKIHRFSLLIAHSIICYVQLFQLFRSFNGILNRRLLKMKKKSSREQSRCGRKIKYKTKNGQKRM